MTRRRIYNPAQLAPEELAASFVARHFELGEMLRIVREQPRDRPCQHFLLIGPRGMGKTTLGLRFLHEIEADAELSTEWQPVPFHEESYGISDLGDFWLTALRHLAHAVRDSKWADIADALSRDATDADRRAAYALDSLLDFRAETGKRLLLFVENLDMIIDQIRYERANHALRAALMTCPDILLMGSACAVFPAIRNYDEALYEFFRLFILEGIDTEESRKIFKTIADTENRSDIPETLESDSGRLEIIRRLTGGNPRLIVLACHLLMDSPAGAAFQALERLIDEQTPYFKALAEQLPPQARKVFHCLAGEWTPMLARDVARAAHLSSSHVSAQLKLLVERGYARESDLPGEKRTRYDLADRFYNIYHLLRFTRANRERLQRLVSFLHDLFGLPAMRSTYAATLQVLRSSDLPISELSDRIAVIARYVAKDVGYAERDDWRLSAQNALKERFGSGAPATGEIQEIFDEQRLSDIVTEVRNLYQSCDYLGAANLYFRTVDAEPGNISVLLETIVTQIKYEIESKNPLAIMKLLELATSSTCSIPPILIVYPAFFAIDTYISHEQFGKVVSVYNRFTKYIDSAEIDWDDSVELREMAAAAHLLGGNAFSLLKKNFEAISCYEHVLDTVYSNGSTSERTTAADACNKWAESLLNLDKYSDVIAVSKRVAEYIKPDDFPHMRLRAILSFCLMGLAFVEQAIAETSRNYDVRHRESASILLDMTKYVSRDDSKKLRRLTARALSMTGAIYAVCGKYLPAEAAYKAAIYIDPAFDGGWRGMAEYMLKYGKEERLPEMEVCAREAVRLAPDEPKNVHILFVILAVRCLWGEALANMETYLQLHRHEPNTEERRLLALLLTMAATEGHAEGVKKLMETASLATPMEPLWHAVRAEAGENIEPLPAEIMDAVEDIRKQIRNGAVN